MSRTPEQTPEAVEAHNVGERPDLGRTPDALAESLTGSGMGSDTRAGSLQGGAASGSDDDPDQAEVDRFMAEQGRAEAEPQSPSSAALAPGEGNDDPVEGPGGDEVEVPTG